MKQLFLGFLFFGTTAVTSPVLATSYWLLMESVSFDGSYEYIKLEVEDLQQCEVQGTRFKSASNLRNQINARNYICLEGK